MFAKFHLKKPQDFLRNALQTDETKVEVIGHTVHHIWRKLNTNCQHEGGGGMIWACLAALGAGHCPQLTMKQSILESDVRPSV